MPIPNDYEGHDAGIQDPATDGVDVTPSNSADLTFMPRAITCLVAGNVQVLWPSGNISTHGIVPGVPFAARVQRIRSTGTTATGIAILK